MGIGIDHLATLLTEAALVFSAFFSYLLPSLRKALPARRRDSGLTQIRRRQFTSVIVVASEKNEHTLDLVLVDEALL